MSALLELRAVGKSFGGLEVVRDLTFGVAAGERVALIGPNGAGKTTVFNLITGVYPVSAGSIRFDGTELDRLPDWRRARLGIARSFQNIRLMPHLTTLENVMLAQTLNARGPADVLFPLGLLRGNRWERDAREALARAGLDAVADALVYDLPYGVQKRIELVRASVAGARLLLLDEPAAGLNPVETRELVAFVRSLSDRGMTLLIVEHDMPFVEQLCSRIVVLNFGEKICDGTVSDVRRDPLVREAYLGTASGA